MSIFKDRGDFQAAVEHAPIASGKPTGGNPGGSEVVPPTHTPLIPAAANDMLR